MSRQKQCQEKCTAKQWGDMYANMQGEDKANQLFSGIVKSAAQETGTTFLHVGIAVFEMAGLVSRGREPGEGRQFVQRIEAGEISSFGKDHGVHTASNAWNGGNGKMKFIYNGVVLY